MIDRKITILVTDGDQTAAKTITRAAEYLGADVIGVSAGNPLLADPKDIIKRIKRSISKLVIVMADDGGKAKAGPGTRAIRKIKKAGKLDAAVVVAADTPGVKGIRIDKSVTRKGQIVQRAVNKNGRLKADLIIKGDTVDGLDKIDVPKIGVGDIGKAPKGRAGVEVLIKAIEEAKKLVP